MDPIRDLVDLARRLDMGPIASAEARTELQARLSRVPVRFLPGLDRAIRDPARHREQPFLELGLHVVAEVSDGGDTAALGILSCVRDGYVREAAVRALGARTDRLSTAFLLIRLNDPVHSVAAAAGLALLDGRRALVPCLPLIGWARRWIRARSRPLLDWLEEEACADRDALRAVAAGRDPDARRAAWQALLGVHLAGRAEDGDALLAAAFDPHAEVRYQALLGEPDREG